MTFDDAQSHVAAGNGSSDAQLKLASDAIEAIEAGKVSRLEGLIVAETMARLALIAGSPLHHIRLAGILYWRADYAAEHGDREEAGRFEIEATAYLAIADEMGSSDAGDVLAAFAHTLDPATVATLARCRGLIRRMAGMEAAE